MSQKALSGIRLYVVPVMKDSGGIIGLKGLTLLNRNGKIIQKQLDLV